MAFQEKQLGQHRINSTTATSLYSPGASTTAIVKSIVICNQSGTADTFRLFVDDDGTTYDETTAVYFDVAIAADTTIQIDTFWPMNDSSGNLATQNATANALTFTAFGVEIT